jgi:hypothetical protein
MDEEQRQKAILTRLMEMGIHVDKPIFTLIWQDVARVMVETEGFEMVADFPTDVLVNILNTIEDGLEYLDWYSNIRTPGVGLRRPGFWDRWVRGERRMYQVAERTEAGK